MSYGPIELLALKFPGNQFTGEIAPALANLVENDLIRIIDLLFVSRDTDDSVTIFELGELDDETLESIDPLVGDLTGMISEEDALYFASSLEPGSSVGLLLFENTWAAAFAEAVRNANGEVMLNERVPRAVIEELLATPA